MYIPQGFRFLEISWEARKILLRYHPRLPGNAKKQVIEFMGKYGGITAEPSELAEHIHDLVRSILPKLVKLSRGFKKPS